MYHPLWYRLRMCGLDIPYGNSGSTSSSSDFEYWKDWGEKKKVTNSDIIKYTMTKEEIALYLKEKYGIDGGE